jgi:GPI ethanolamine phosphate transferase 1
MIRTVFTSILPFISDSEHPSSHSRILSLFLGYAPCFIILTNSTEGLFYLAYAVLVVVWVEVEVLLRQRVAEPNKNASANVEQKNLKENILETKNNDSTAVTLGNTMISYKFQADDLRIALFFLFFIQIAFFGTGK